MEKLKIGEVAVLEDGKEYIVFSQLVNNGTDYIYLVSNFKPLKVRFAKQILEGDTLNLELISEQEEKERLLYLFQKSGEKQS